ncbi:uncharacterized protein tasor2 isoform X2 [Sebastes umbrosus]|uniref:uncharacterized protein tasor2 isoform X2 n=1 Tax=Sebastes umbrosus TaxID=72105 RepID=UPI00189EAB35|nr:uncharacterized protein tasor2 isoform X2 [Sebastes umbrosus]
MESVAGGASSKGVLVPVSETSVVFQNNILAPLKSAYLYEESKQSFRYKSAVLVNNKAQEEKYCAFRAKRREEGYSEEDLKESYGFLLFDDVNKANALGESGVLNGNSTCTTLGDPSNGVYISMYSDCLDLNRWYHGKSGYIAIIRLTKGRVKKVLENYTQNFTAPTVGFDCHVSEQLPSVSAKTSSFLAFERTQYYMYELLNDGSDVTTQSPSAACPFAIVSFSYTDTKATLEAPQEKSEEKKLAGHYLLWKGQLQIGTQFYDVGLRSTAGALIPAELPPVVKIDRAISMLDLRQLLPKAVFETCFSREVFLDGLYCSLCELVSSEAEDTSSLSLLLREIKEKDLALTIQLNDGGFLILLHPSHFLTYDDTGSSATDVLQGMFVFPVSQVIQRDTKSGHRKCAMSSEILQVLPVLSYAEGEVEKAPMDPGEELCEVLTQHMQSYAALINPGLASSPSREVSMFPDQYDVPDAHKHLYSSPEWTNRAWQSFKSYLSKPVSFQLPVSKASEILAAGKEERIEDLDDDVYICLSSPEEVPTNPVNMESEDQLTGQRSPVNVETSVDSCITSTEAQVDSTAVPQNVAPDDLQAGDASKGICKSDQTMLIKTDDMGAKNLLIPSTSDELPAELIVSITSAEQAVTDESLSMINAVSATKHNDFQLSGFPTDKLQMAGVNSLNDETATTKTILDCPEVTNLTKTKQRKLRRGQSKVQKRVSKACIETPNLQIPVEDVNLKSQKEDLAKESSPQLSSPSTVDQRKVGRRKRNFRMPSSKYLNLRSASVGLEEPEEQKTDPGQESLESTVLMDLEAFPLRKKTERWDLKPVISECGRILVPHGSVDIADLKFLKAKLQSRKDEQCPEKMLVDTSVNAHGTVEIQQESRTALETAVGETEATTSKDGGNHLQNVVVSDVNPELSILRSSDDGNGSLTLNRESSEHSSKTDGTATPPSEAVKEKLTEKIAAKGEFLLSKLKSVLLRGKRKTDLLGETTADGAQDAEPCLKKGRVDSQTGMLMSNYAITSVQDANVKDVSKMLSVDPLFAYALGLTPKEPPDKVTEGQDTQQRKDSSKTQEQTILDEQPQILHRPPSIFPRRGRIKTLKKHQGISTEYVKKKWWLHFQTPACFASEKLKNKECTRDNSVRKTVKEKMTSACSSTDALNLLADLALGASNDQVPPQPDPALGRKPETGLKKCDLTKDVTSAEQESVLHALLRQPAAAARPTQPLESPTPSHLVGGTELVDLVSKEHAYSLPPSSSLLLGLPGTPFQVSPLSGSTRLLHHHHTLYGNGIKTLHPSVGQKDRNDQNCRTPECLKKHMVCRRKFRQTRTFIDQDGSIQVTKQWEENYDFDLDSKFTSDPKDRTIVRALHGPWDFSMQDTSEEVRLIVHMWIGLFYSRSTARFFHDSYPCSEESDSLEMPSAMVPAPAQSDLKANSFAPFPSTTDTADPSISKALDLSKKDNSVLDQGSVVLDLSLRNSNAEIVTSDPQVNRKETSVSSDGKEASETLNTLKSSVELQEAIQCQKETVQSTEIINEVNDVRSASENKKSCTPSQKTGSLEHTKGPSCKGDGTFILVQEAMESVSVQPENDQTASGIGYLLHGCSNEKRDMKDGIENSEATEMSLLQKHGRDSSKSVTDKEVVSNKAASDVVHTVEHDENESKHRESWKVKEKTYQEGNVEPSPKLIHTNDDSTNKESGIFYNGNLLENDKQLSREEPKAISPGKADNVNEDVDDCTVHKGKVMKHEDHFEREDGLEEKDRCVSPVQADSDLSDQPNRENWKVKEKTCQEGNVEPSPKLIHTNDDSTNKESGIFYNGNLLENDKQLSREEPKAISPGKADNVNEDVDDCTVHKGKVMKCEDHFEKEDGLEEKDRCISPVQADSDLSDQPDRENWKVKEKTCQEGKVEPSPKLIHTNEDSTNKESGIFYNGNLLENDKQLSGEEPKAISPGKADNVNEDVDDCTVHKGKVMKHEDHFEKEDGLEEKDCCVSPVQADSDLSDQPDRGNWKVKHEDHFEKEDGLEEKDRCVSPVQADSDLSDQPAPMMCDGPDSLKKDSITESNPEPPLDEQPPQADNEDDACHDLQLKKLCANGSGLTDEPAILEKCPPAPSEMEHISAETAVGKSSENDICLAAKTELPMSDENNCSLDGSVPQTNGSVETGSPNKVMANFNQTSDYHENLDTKAIEGEQNVDNTTEKEPFHHQSHSPQCEAEVALTKETYLKQIDKTNEGLEKIHNVVVIPFIGIDTSGEDTIQPHVSHSQGKIEEVVQCQEKIPFISETTYPETVQPTEVCSTSQMYSQKAELSAGKISLSHIDASETNQPVASESESDDRCSTPTMDEKPYEYLTCSGPSSTSASAFSGHETFKNLTQKSPSRGSTSMKEDMPHKSTVNKDANLHHLHPDLELRTLRVLQSIDKFLSKSSHTDTSSQMKTADMKHSLDQTPYPRSKYIPTCLASSHTSSDSKDKKIRNTTPAVVSASTSQELHTESTGHFLISPFKSKLEEVLGVKLQLQKTDSVHQHYFERTDKLQETSVRRDCHSYRSVPSTESLRAIKPNIDQDKLKTTSQTNLSHEPHSYSQRPVMAVKPSKSDENQADYMSKDRQIENTVMSHKIPLITCTIPTTMLLEKKTERLKRTSEGLNDDKQDASELPSKSNWFSNVSASKPNSDQAKFVCLDPLYQHKGRDFSKFNKIPSSSLPLQSFEYAKSSSKRVDGNQGVMTFHEQVGQTTKECIAMDQKDCSDASTSHADFKDGGIIDESLYLGPQSSLMCTVYNTSQKRSYSFLEQVSQRCLQDDPTEASMEKESLIFSEQMKQLLKRTKREHNRQQDTHDKQNLSCASPVTVHFCSLEEQEDSVDHLNAHLDAPSLFGQKIKVDMSDRKYLTDTTEEDKTLHPQKISQGTGNPMEHAGVSGVTSECTRVYEAMMNDVCAVKTVPSRPKHFRMDGVYPKTEPSYHFDFCDEMKKEMESFRSSLNSVVKKSCKTKYRFYILVTSDDAFFEETKAHLEAEGHTAVQPSEFFLGEDSSSSLLIILRNEDIAEHICEVPHLLELKKSPGVHFAGIDEPDDVVNLTHQELFTRGGFIMFDRAALEPLSLCNLKKMSEILQELSRTGKWKWMLHYRDSRRLKENARLSAEAKEKKHFLNWCQETGILEVLPYHECDLMSKDQPDYLSCLARLQVQNISARCPVFITDTTTDSAFGKNGILTTTFESFLTYSPSKTFTA